VLIAREVDREYWENETGTYYVCIQAFSSVSAAVTATEISSDEIYDVEY